MGSLSWLVIHIDVYNDALSGLELAEVIGVAPDRDVTLGVAVKLVCLSVLRPRGRGGLWVR